MPLLDHFRPPLKNHPQWSTLHNGWMGNIALRLNALLPPDFVAYDHMYIDGGMEVDIGTVEEIDPDPSHGSNGINGSGGVALAQQKAVYTPPDATGIASFDLADITEIRVFTNRGEGRLVAAIELVNPGNKDSSIKREAFIAKCVDYLCSGAGVLIVDAIADKHMNLHNEIVRALDAPLEFELPEETHLYATAYRPVIRGKKTQIEFWIDPIAIGEPLPTMPLRLIGDLFVPVELERTYTETCVGRRLL